MIWGKKYQDSIQQTGGMKYFVYSALLKVTQTNSLLDGISFPIVWDRMLDYYNRWESRHFNNDYHMERYYKSSGSTMIPRHALVINYIDTPSENNMRQDRAYVNFVFKTDIYNSTGHLINPTDNNWHQRSDCLSGNKNNECTYLVPMYYVIRC